MKFSTSTALFAISSAAFVAAAPVVVQQSATTSAAKASFSQVNLGSDAADSGLFAALLDPTFVDADGNVDFGDVIDDTTKTSSQASPSTSSSASRPFTLRIGTPAQPSPAAVAAAAAQGSKVVVTIPGQTRTTTSTSRYFGGSAYTSTIYQTKPGSTIVNTYTKPGSTSTVTNYRTNTPSTSTVVKYSTPSPVQINIPGKTSTAYTTRTTGGAVNVANQGTPKVVGGYTSTVIVPSSSLVIVTIPGKTSTLTSYRTLAPATKPTSAAAINPAAQGSPSFKAPSVAAPKPTNAAPIAAQQQQGGYTATVTVPSSRFTTVVVPGRTSWTTIKSYYYATHGAPPRTSTIINPVVKPTSSAK